jgi:UDP-glucuronate 4-epimerase
VPATEADCTDLARDMGYAPSVSVEEGVAKFVAWYRDYYGDGQTRGREASAAAEATAG